MGAGLSHIKKNNIVSSDFQCSLEGTIIFCLLLNSSDWKVKTHTHTHTKNYWVFWSRKSVSKETHCRDMVHQKITIRIFNWNIQAMKLPIQEECTVAWQNKEWSLSCLYYLYSKQNSSFWKSQVTHLARKLIHWSQVVFVQDAVPKSITKAPEKGRELVVF